MNTRDRIVAFVTSYITLHGYSPTVREICDGCGVSSTSVVAYHLALLEGAGRITRVPAIARSIRVVA